MQKSIVAFKNVVCLSEKRDVLPAERTDLGNQSKLSRDNGAEHHLHNNARYPERMTGEREHKLR